MLAANRKPARNLERPGEKELLKHPMNDGGIPGLKMAVMDSGASVICMKSEDSSLEISHAEFQKPISLGLEIIGRGQTAF